MHGPTTDSGVTEPKNQVTTKTALAIEFLETRASFCVPALMVMKNVVSAACSVVMPSGAFKQTFNDRRAMIAEPEQQEVTSPCQDSDGELRSR